MITRVALPVQAGTTPDQFFDAVSKWCMDVGFLSAPISVLSQGTGTIQELKSFHCRVTILKDAEKHTFAVQIRRIGIRPSQFRFWEYILNMQERYLYVRQGYIGTGMNAGHVKGKPVSSPDFIRTVIDQGLTAAVDGIPLSYEPFVIRESNLPNVKDCARFLAMGSKKDDQRIRLPLIFIPHKRAHNMSSLASELASRLKGMAHVMIPANRKVQNLLFSIERFNLKPGHITIIFPPDKANESQRIEYYRVFSIQKRKDAIIKRLIRSASQATSACCPSFQSIQCALQKKELIDLQNTVHVERSIRMDAEIKVKTHVLQMQDERERIHREAADKAFSEAETISKAYEEDISILTDQNYQLNLTVQGLENENSRLRTRRHDSGQIPLLYFGSEREFYVGEIPDLVMSVLEDSLKGMPDNSRRKDVVTDILAANHYRHIGRARTQKIRNILKSYKGMTAELRSKLEEAGFQIEETSNHCKVSYFGDRRYLAVLGSTPSDVRSGRNNAAKLVRMAY